MWGCFKLNNLLGKEVQGVPTAPKCFVVSDDFGATRTEYHVGIYTNYAASWFDGAFMNLIVNLLFVMSKGELILPHIMEKANNETIV